MNYTILTGQKNTPAEKYFLKADDFKKNASPDSAIYYYKKAAEEFKTNKKTENLILSYNQIGALLTRQEKFEEGRMYFGMAEVQGKSLKDTNNLLRASTFTGTGIIYNSVGDFNGALAYHRRALVIRMNKSGEKNADVATSYGNIGNVYLNLKDYDSSIEAHLKAMAIREKLFGKNSAEITQSYNNLGIVYKEKGDYLNSLDYLLKAVQNKIALLGPEHKDLVKLYNSISSDYYIMGKTDEGDLYKARAEEILKK